MLLFYARLPMVGLMRHGEPDPSPGAPVHIETRFFPVSDALRPYATIIYRTDIAAPPGTRVDDYLHPEWANMRFVEGELPRAAIGGGVPVTTPRFIVTGPTSKASYFTSGTMRVWGIGILPVGWAKYFAIPAGDIADRFFDGSTHPAFTSFVPLADRLPGLDDAAAARAIDDHFVQRLAHAPRDDPAILAAHRALVDDELASVAALAEKLGLSERSVERLSRRAFGFPPKLLLRRQRFLRSLARFMLDPAMAWIDALDYHYYDQAQFTRDFQRFMGMSPRAYAARPKPILGAAALARAAAAGAAVQGLHQPFQG
jgi:AraC-like DNA-binding protein